MIAARPGYVAVYERGEHYHPSYKVVAWDDDGMPLVLSWEGEPQGLTRADEHNGYIGVSYDREPPIVQVMPAVAGWHCREDVEGEDWVQPIIGWGLRANGRLVPLLPDDSELIEGIGKHCEVEFQAGT